MKHLKENNISYWKHWLFAMKLTNKMGPDKLSGEWIFEKPKKLVRSRKKPKKVEKTLDKSQEDVIIKVQEKTLSPKEE